MSRYADDVNFRLAVISEVPFNNGTIDDAVRKLLKEYEAKTNVLVLSGAEHIMQFGAQIKNFQTLVSAMREKLPDDLELEAAYKLASWRLNVLVRRGGGNPVELQADGGLIKTSDPPSLEVGAIKALARGGYTIIVIPPLRTEEPFARMNTDTFLNLLSKELGTSLEKL